MRDVDFIETIPVPKSQVKSTSKPAADQQQHIPAEPTSASVPVSQVNMDLRTVNTRMFSLERARVRYMHHSVDGYSVIALPIFAQSKSARLSDSNESTSSERGGGNGSAAGSGPAGAEEPASKRDDGYNVEFELDILLPDAVDGLCGVEVKDTCHPG